MNHAEALQAMALESYLLDDLSIEEKQAFEQHMFGCLDCTHDLQIGEVLVREIKRTF